MAPLTFEHSRCDPGSVIENQDLLVEHTNSSVTLDGVAKHSANDSIISKGWINKYFQNGWPSKIEEQFKLY